ncbi:MAG: DNA metabolism protein [Clostridiales bacterium]|nr:DNA metabolism protein [Clostridiales bacterium]
MFDRADVVYVYDGSFQGLMCCIFECFVRKETPAAVVCEADYQPTLNTLVSIPTDTVKSKRVENGILRKTSAAAMQFVRDGYYTCAPDKDLLILKFVQLGMERGAKVMSMLGDDTVSALTKAVMNRSREAHNYLGFARFSIYGEVMVSVIEPKNFVLPIIGPHFCDRYRNESFMIYDKTHSAALIYRPYEWEIIHIDSYTEPETQDDEAAYRSMWKMFYETIAIAERENPKCRMNHMPKRFWSRLPEMDEAVSALKGNQEPPHSLESPHR